MNYQTLVVIIFILNIKYSIFIQLQLGELKNVKAVNTRFVNEVIELTHLNFFQPLLLFYLTAANT